MVGVIRSFSAVVCHLVAVTSAIVRSVRHAGALEIQNREWGRYLKKSANFGLCYVGLGPRGGLREAWRAGEAAFLCCAYDVVTDWRGYDPVLERRYERILFDAQSDAYIRELATDLYAKERHGTLANDGLERGAIALRFTLAVMGSEAIAKQQFGDVDRLGTLLQIVDDVLDYEDDVIRSECNCLTSERRSDYLQMLLSELREDEAQRYFGARPSLLTVVLRQARSKAARMLAASEKPAPRAVA